MRIENIGSSRNIPDSPQRPGLAEGDVLIAEVTDIKGDKVFLKNQESGAIFTAKLLNDIGVTVGDYVETVVDEADGGRYVLRVIDISRQSPFLTESGASADASAMSQAAKTQTLLSTLAMLKNNPGADPKAAAFLSRHGIAGTAENIESVAQMAKGISPVAELLTQIIGGLGKNPKTVSQNGFNVKLTDSASQNAQRPQATMQIGTEEQASSAGEAAMRIISGTAEQSKAQGLPGMSENQSPYPSGTIPINADAAPTGAKTVLQAGTLPNTANVPTEQADRSLPAPTIQATPTAQIGDTDNVRTILPGTRPEGSKEPLMPQTAAVFEPDTAQTAISPKAAILPDLSIEIGAPVRLLADEPSLGANIGITPEFLEDSAKPVIMPALNMITMEDIDTAEPKNRELIQKVLDMFARIDDADELTIHLKKVVKEMPEQLKELKLLAQDADIKVREAVTQSLDRADKQLSLMSEVKRFDCYQIPLQTGPQQQDMAELFVYRYRGGKKSVDPDNIMILVGLDTQHMGRVETLIKTNGKSLGIEFNVEDMRLADEMRLDAAALKGAVQQAGYTLLGISVKELALRTTVLNAEERFEKQADGSAGNLDIRV